MSYDYNNYPNMIWDKRNKCFISTIYGHDIPRAELVKLLDCPLTEEQIIWVKTVTKMQPPIDSEV